MAKNDLKILALIPARGGSKGIPKKNIVNLNGYPLITYSIAAAKLSKYINRIIVTTDNKLIAGISRKFGAQVPFLRPKEISQDNSLDVEFFRHALDWLKVHENYIPDLVVHLRPSTPLREAKVIDRAILEMLKDKKATALRSGENFRRESPYKLFKKEGAYCHFYGQEDFAGNQEYYNYPRQKLPRVYRPNGYVDVLLPKILLKTGLLHGKRIRAFITEEVADIDNQQDLLTARNLCSRGKFKPLLVKLRETKR